jgi:hypothetical protein
MFTQSMPQLAQALSGALPEAALKQLMQALGNCQQPLTHRGSVNFVPPTTTGVGGLKKSGSWNPAQYQNLMPNAGSQGYVDMPSNGPTTTVNNTSNYAGGNFSFPMNQEFTYSSYYGGSTFNVLGDTNFQNITTNNITINQGGGGVSFGPQGPGGFPSPPQQPSGGPGFDPGPGDGGGFGGDTGMGGGGGTTYVFPMPRFPGFPGFPGGPGWPRGNPGPGPNPGPTSRGRVVVPTVTGATLGGSSNQTVSSQGSVSIPIVTGAKLNDDCTITLTTSSQMAEVSVTGTVSVPTTVSLTKGTQVQQVVP